MGCVSLEKVARVITKAAFMGDWVLLDNLDLQLGII